MKKIFTSLLILAACVLAVNAQNGSRTSSRENKQSEKSMETLQVKTIAADQNQLSLVNHQAKTKQKASSRVSAESNASLVLLEAADGKATTASAISSDGKYIVGSVGAPNHHLFVWTLDGGIDEWDRDNANEMGQGATVYGVSPSGRVVGVAVDHDQLVDMDGYNPETGEYGTFPVSILRAAYCDNSAQEWTLLPQKNTSPLVHGYVPQAYGISDSGSYIVGCQTPGGYEAPYAGFWDVSDPESVMFFKLKNKNNHSRSEALCISGNGRVIAGWSSESTVEKIPAIWVDEVQIQIEGLSTIDGIARAVSNDGKYVALTVNGKAAYYDIENEQYVLLDEEVQYSQAMGVSNNRIIVGQTGLKSFFQDTRNAFIYTRSTGMVELGAFLSEHGITYPEGLQFKSLNGITADGSIAFGQALKNGVAVSFYVNLPEIDDSIYPIEQLSINNNTYGVAELNWELPQSAGFTGFNVYYDDQFIETLAADVTSYEHAGITDGTHQYYVTVLYGDKESRPSRTVQVTMGKKTLPYYEPFNECAVASMFSQGIPLSQVLWDVTANTIPLANSWTVGASGLPGPCALFLSPKGATFKESLTSPFLDARNTEKLTLRINVFIYGASTQEVLHVEIYDGSEWHNLGDLTADGTWPFGFLPLEYDASVAAGKDNVRIRFTCEGSEGKGDLNWNVENVDLFDPTLGSGIESPLDIVAINDSDNDAIYVSWVAPDASAELRYLYTSEWTGTKIGNGGKPFIAANMYPASYLQLYEGYKLTSLTFMPTSNNMGGAMAEYKWYVAQGGKRLYEAPVENPIAEQWNTVELENPVTIDINQPLYYGVEVVSHTEADLPVATSDVFKLEEDFSWTSLNVADGRGNIYSDDNGETWKTLPLFVYEDEAAQKFYDVYQLFCIAATIKKDPAQESNERIWGYRVKKNGENVLIKTLGNEQTLSPLTSFIDIDRLPAGEEACYEVAVFYNNQLESETVSSCITLTDIKAVQPENPLTVSRKADCFEITYPADTNVSRLSLYSVSGQCIATYPLDSSGSFTLPTAYLPNGVYVLNFEGANLSIKIVK